MKISNIFKNKIDKKPIEHTDEASLIEGVILLRSILSILCSSPILVKPRSIGCSKENRIENGIKFYSKTFG